MSPQDILTRKQEVTLMGQVKSPGKYLYYTNMKLSELLDLGSGFNDTTYLKSVYKPQAEIIRKKPNDRYEKVISININDILEDNIDYQLQESRSNYSPRKFKLL